MSKSDGFVALNHSCLLSASMLESESYSRFSQYGRTPEELLPLIARWISEVCIHSLKSECPRKQFHSLVLGSVSLHLPIISLYLLE